ncbi:hypothetical protein [Kaistia terrae]|uniref:Uncharacterized protein n=1 Tax=Kaistia terrae TaxID=537017 RepID=A0ABW0Q2U1_9HYPH|nr:hypothetical protein [Kaistia terrae]MCX5581475.1 hypothetical protein [Kaistia terrae]
MTEKEAKVVVLDARRRVHGLSESTAGLAEAGSSLGRLMLAGAITNRLYAAGNRFAEDVWRYHSLTGIPHPNPKSCWNFVAKAEPVDEKDRDKSITPGIRATYTENSPEFMQAVKTATNRYMNAIGVVQQNDRTGRPVETTLRNVVILDMDAANWPPHMIKMLRRVLKALADWYGIPEGSEDQVKHWGGRRSDESISGLALDTMRKSVQV